MTAVSIMISGEAARLLVELFDAAADEFVVAAVECRFKFSSSGLDLFVLGAGELLPCRRFFTLFNGGQNRLRLIFRLDYLDVR